MCLKYFDDCKQVNENDEMINLFQMQMILIFDFNNEYFNRYFVFSTIICFWMIICLFSVQKHLTDYHQIQHSKKLLENSFNKLNTLIYFMFNRNDSFL
jgi:hypothetical protein